MEIEEFKQCLKPYQAIMGFDFGTKRLGVAVSDLLRTIATSYKIIERKDWPTDINEIKKIIQEKEIGAIVYGLPLQMNGQEGEIAIKVREFAEKIYLETNLPYMFWDERLSSSAVENFLIKEVDLSRMKRKKVLDASAAAYILQGALDRLAR
ncbi:MAG: Holliday junction resolvase RuvX [Alphaproteobacteria bacterium]|nr:Holliday junction resolvase RuvX [Alphaproteobacteria bacterium]